MKANDQALASSAAVLNAVTATSGNNMYVIEREIPGAGKLTPDQLKDIAAKSNGVLDDMGTEVQWVHSYVTDEKIYCVYTAPNVEMVQEHARKGGFPANSISKVSTVIDPATAG